MIEPDSSESHAAFESFAEDAGYMMNKTLSGLYASEHTENAWITWRAALKFAAEQKEKGE